MEWKKIDGYENYSVSENGEVRNDKTGRVLKLHYSQGYQLVELFKNGKSKRLYVHRLVAQTFIPNPENKPCVDHINTIRDDNRVENLRWCTYKENNNNPLTKKKNSEAKSGENHPFYGKQLSEKHKQKISEAQKGEKHHFYGKRHCEETKKKMSESHSGENNPCCKKIICITTGEIFDYMKLASEKYQVDPSNISKCCRGKRKSAGEDIETGEPLVWMYYFDNNEGAIKDE